MPAEFHLVQRGQTSAFLSERGFVSQQSGDEDFDGLFHHHGKAAIKAGQRGLLVDLWQLLPEFSIDHDKISGQLVYEQSPQGLAKLNQAVERLQSLQQQFPGAEAYARTRPVGFVRRQKLSQESVVCWAGAAIAAAPAIGYATFADLAGSSPLSAASLGCLLLLLTAAGFVASGFKVSLQPRSVGDGAPTKAENPERSRGQDSRSFAVSGCKQRADPRNRGRSSFHQESIRRR